MKEVSTQTFQEIFRSEKVQKLSDDYVSDEIMEFTHPFVSARHRVIKIEGISIVYRDWMVPSPLSMRTVHEEPFLKMQFEIEGHSAFTHKMLISCKHIDILHGKHTLLFLPEVDGTLFYPNSRKVLDVIFTVDFFKKLFGMDMNCLDSFGDAIEKSVPHLIGSESKVITATMSKVINDILYCEFHGIFKKTYIEAKVVELLNLQLAQFRKERDSTSIKLRKDDIDRLYHLKERIDANPGAPYSLAQLAEVAGFNDFKLKKGFKQLFGQTVFGYIHDVRMKSAYTLLQKGEHNVTDVSYLMGYKYVHHFSKAFKKKYGFTPKNIAK